MHLDDPTTQGILAALVLAALAAIKPIITQLGRAGVAWGRALERQADQKFREVDERESCKDETEQLSEDHRRAEVKRHLSQTMTGMLTPGSVIEKAVTAKRDSDRPEARNSDAPSK